MGLSGVSGRWLLPGMHLYGMFSGRAFPHPSEALLPACTQIEATRVTRATRTTTWKMDYGDYKWPAQDECNFFIYYY